MKNIFEKLITDSSSKDIPSITEASEIFNKATEKDFLDYITYLLEKGKGRKFEIFLYYLLLFRDKPNVQDFLNLEKVPIPFIEHIILYSHGYTTLKGGKTDTILDDLLYFISQEKLLGILLESKNISRDMMMVFFILTKLDTKRLDEFFGKTDKVDFLLSTFVNLEPNLVKEIIYRNIDMFTFLINMLPSHLGEAAASKMSEAYSTELNMFREINNLLTSFQNYALKNRAQGRVDIARLNYLVRIFEAAGDSPLSLDTYISTKITVTEMEKLLAHEIIRNPLHKQILKKIHESTFFASDDHVLF